MCEYGNEIAGYWKFSGEEHVEALQAQMLSWQEGHDGHYRELTLIRCQKSQKPTDLMIFFHYVIPSGKEIEAYSNVWKGSVVAGLRERFGFNFLGWRSGKVLSAAHS